jgi:hypothetical protein
MPGCHFVYVIYGQMIDGFFSLEIAYPKNHHDEMKTAIFELL